MGTTASAPKPDEGHHERMVLRGALPEHEAATALCSFIDANLPGTVPLAATDPDELQPDVGDPGNTKLARGIDVPFASNSAAREAESQVRQALLESGNDRVTTWLWRRTSGGIAATPADLTTGRELRIQPRK